jgi:hypothetical protein
MLNWPVGFKPDFASFTNLDAMAWQMVSKGRKGDMNATERVIDRIWGKTPQPVTGADGGPLKIVIEEITAE